MPCRCRGSGEFCGGDSGQELADFFRAEGFGEEEALAVLAVLVAEGVALDASFDAFGHGFELEGLAEVEEAANDGGDLVAVGDAVDEGSVDFEDVDGELAEVGQG